MPPTATAIEVVKTAISSWDSALRIEVDLGKVGDTPAATEAETKSAKSGILKTLNEIVKAQKDEYIRPGGSKYVPREMTIEGKRVHDVTFVRMAYKNRMPVLLYGDPGTGKTALLEAALDDLITVQGTVETETADFVGSWTQQTDGTYKWVDGPLVVAMEEGRPLLVDEVALVDSRVMAVAYGVMDGRDELVITANPERGKVHVTDGFMVFGACNPDVPGAVMSDALLSRFQFHIEVGTDWGLTKQLGIDPRIVQVARNLNLKKRDFAVTAAPQLRELLTFQAIRENFGEAMALSNFVSQARSEDRDAVSEAIESVFGAKATTLTL